MAQRTLVHKQFNSPIGLYSDRNVRETLDRELRTLSNGVVGIDFEHNPTASKPANLANSAVLRMLEEEEQEQRRSGSQPDGGRRSRSRYREIDRDTVLRINRHRPRRQFSWPPKLRSQSAGAPSGGSRGERRDLSLDSKLSHGAAGATIAEDLSALQQRGELAQQRRKGALPPPKPRRQADYKSQANRERVSISDLDASHNPRAGWHQNSSAESQSINSRQKASDSGASVNLDTVQSVPHPTDSPPSNDWHSSADAGMVFTVIETPVYCLFCAAKDCDCTRRERLDLSEVETLAEVSRKIVAEGEEELVRQKEAEELDAAIRELIDFASVVKKRPEIMNPAYIPIVEGCLQELALLAMLHSQGRIALRPETPKRATIEELPGNSSQSAAASDTGICRNLPKMSDDLVGDNHNKRERRESPTESFAGEKFIPTEGLRRVAWPPPSDVTVHPSQVPLNYNQQPQDQQQYQPAAAPAPAATSLQDGASYSAQPAAAPLSPVGVPQAYTQAQYAQPQSYTSPQYNQPQYNQPQYPQSPVSQPPQASRQFPAPAPSYLNRPAVPRGSSPSTAAFSGGVALGQPQAQQSQVPAWRRAASQPSAPLSPPTAQFSSPDPSASTLSPGGTSPTPRGWAPVKAATPTYGQTYTQQVPAATHYQAPTYEADPYQDQFQAQNQFQTQSYQTTTSYQATETQQHQQYYQPAVRQPSPGVITLRTELPVSQAPAPVYASQPPVFSFKGGSNMRGDQKWPPVEYKQQAAAENEARLRLAAGPACRPRRCNKDYTAFFAKNALSHNYPGYRVPPGTQHVNGQSMM